MVPFFHSTKHLKLVLQHACAKHFGGFGSETKMKRLRGREKIVFQYSCPNLGAGTGDLVSVFHL